MPEGLHIISGSRFTATPPAQASPSLRASSFRSSDGSIAQLRRSSSAASVIPESDSTLDSTLKGDLFKVAVVKILIKLKLTHWKLTEAENLMIKVIASALTNSVYLLVLDDQKLLLRIYGPNVLHLIDREYETSVLARLAHHRIGPRLLGQFKNGRIEQWLESVEVNAQEIRQASVSRYIARRLREFHDFVTLLPAEMYRVSAGVNLDGWIPALSLDKLTPSFKQFLSHICRYRDFLKGKEGEIVFCHNDLQYGNLLRTKGEEHNCLAVIDFEYAGPNPRAFDIANHFIEWMANYHEAPSYELDPRRYPSFQESQNFLREYIRFGKLIARREDPIVYDSEVEHLSHSVDLWRAMSHAQWAIWGLIQALPDSKVAAASVPSEVARNMESNVQRASNKRRGSRTAQSPLTGGMKSPFLPPSQSPTIVARRSSYKSPSYFPVVMEDVKDEFSIGESAIPGVPLSTDDVLTSDPEASEWMDDEEPGFDYVAYTNQRIGLFYGELLRMNLVQLAEVPADVIVKHLPASAFRPAAADHALATGTA